jgi:4-carboxymuconolactone decarboxylase
MADRLSSAADGRRPDHAAAAGAAGRLDPASVQAAASACNRPSRGRPGVNGSNGPGQADGADFTVTRENAMNKEAFEKGLKTRREVLGAEYVDASIRNADDFNRPMQELVTEYCWNEIWNRPGLDRRTRSFLNLAMITALNRPHELKLHVRGAINNGLTKEEIREVFLQAAIYCGVPAAIDSFRSAKEVFKEMGI